MEFTFLLEILGFLLAIGFGLGVGSYSTMPYYRLPNGKACAGKWIGEKSSCTSCGHQLRTRDLIPVFNWLLTRGKCQFCGYKINPVYFFIEFSVTILSVLIYLKHGFEQEYMLILGLAACLVIASATDFTFRVIPDQVLVVALMFGFLYRPLIDGQIYDMIMCLSYTVLVGVAFAKLYENKTGKELASYRYIKLFSVSAIWLGFLQMFVLVATSVPLILIAYAYGKNKKIDGKYFLAPAITIPFILVLLYV